MKVDALCTVFESILQQHGEEDAKQGWRKHTALLNSAADWEGVRGSSIEAHSAVHALVEGCCHAKQSWGDPSFRRSLKRPSVLTRSNAFVRSMKARYKGTSLVTDAPRKSCPLWIFRRENRTGTKGRFAPRGSVGVSRPLGRILCR